jgi:hypothetical protein
VQPSALAGVTKQSDQFVLMRPRPRTGRVRYGASWSGA